MLVAASTAIGGQAIVRELKVSPGQTVEVVNRYGRIDIVAQESAPKSATSEAIDQTENGNPSGTSEPAADTGKLTVISNDELLEREIISTGSKGNFLIEVKPGSISKRIDLQLLLPERTKLIVETRDGGILVDGNFALIRATSDTGTIAVDVPTDDVSYNLLWTTSKPRLLSDFTLAEIRERSGGRFEIKGRYPTEVKSKKEKGKTDNVEPPVSSDGEKDSTSSNEKPVESKDTEKKKDKKRKIDPLTSTAVSLEFTTARGIVLLNVPPNEVMSDLRERPLTDAAKAIVKSGDADLVEAIRRASPKHFGDFAKTLPPARFLPSLSTTERADDIERENVKTVTARVLDVHNRAIGSLKPEDFEVTERGEIRDVISVKPVSAPVNLVLLLDVSGSVDNYVNFIRKAARAFVNTVDREDKISIITFNDDVKTIATFTTNRQQLSESLDTFDAGGATAYYDAIGYTLTETLRPMRGDRTAIVILTDGDDNRSFLPFDSLASSIDESGALIYPLYVPTSLAAMGATSDLNAPADPLRQRYLNLSLTSKAEAEGARLAKLSGGIYYSITELSQIQRAYDDIVLQLRTAYDVTFKSSIIEAPSRTGVPNSRPSPRLKIRVKRPDTYVQLNNIRR